MKTRQTGMLTHIVATSALLILCAAAPALAKGNAANGLTLARQWCSSCHAVEPQGPATDKAPPFAEIAQTHDSKWTTAWLADPHPPMKGIELSNAQIADVVAYLQTLAKP
jgi:mono/diheme cytochrome c family protein